MKDWNDMSEKEQLLQYISDEHKSAYGFRPRGSYDHMTVVELRAELTRLNDEANRIYDEEKALEVERLEEFEERLFWIQEDLGATDRMEALRWVVQDDEDAQYDPSYFMYINGFSEYTNDAARNLLSEIVHINKRLAA